MIHSLLSSFVATQEPASIQALKDFDANEYEADILLSLDLSTLADPELTRRIVKEALKSKVNELMKEYMKEQHNRSISPESSGKD